MNEEYIEYAEKVVQRDPRLGRNIVHDSRSRGFAMGLTPDRSTWVTKSLRIYDPLPNENQCHGECTCCAQCMLFNTAHNRKTGQVLRMDTAHKLYSLATSIDPFEGSWTSPTWEDTGSSGLAAAKASQQLGLGGPYRFIFGGADEVVQTIMSGRTVSLGTAWYDGMFYPDSRNTIHPTGALAGGHQYVARGYVLSSDKVKIRCWWGDFRDVLIKRTALNDLLMDNGDAHTQDIAV